MKQRFIVAVVMLLVLLCMASCGHDEQDIHEMVYGIGYAREEAIELPREVLAGENGVWVLTAEKENCLYFVNEAVTVTDWGKKEGEYIIALAERENALYLLVGSEQGAQIRKKKSDNRWESLTDISSELVGNINETSDFWVDRDENFYLVINNNILIIDGENHVSKWSEDMSCAAFLEDFDGKVQCVAGSCENIKLLDIGEAGMAEKWSISYSCREGIQVLYSDTSQICLLADDHLLCIETASSRILSRSNLLQSGISYAKIYAGYIENQGLENERIYLYGKSVNGNMEIYALVRQEEASLNQRKQISYGTFMLNSAMQEQIVAFNKENDAYYVTVKVYGNGDLESGKLQLQADMAGGTAPDIIDLYSFSDYFTYAKQGYLEDLTPYLTEKDHDNEVQWQILEPYQIEQKIYVLMPHYSVSGLVISPEDSEHITDWNMDAMFWLMEQNNGEKNIFVDSSAKQILSYAVWGMQGIFMDQATGKTDFNCPEFTDLLKYCKQYGRDDTNPGAAISMEEMAEKTLFLNMTFTCPQDYMVLFNGYGRNVEIYGYPTDASQQYLINMTADACGLYAKSNNKEGAWEFMQSLIDTSFQQREDIGFAVCNSAFQNAWEKAKSQSVRINNVEVEPVTDGEAAIFEKIVQTGAFQSGLLDAEIKNVILEEAEVFFQGDKSAEEVAQIIQNRVQLILDE